MTVDLPMNFSDLYEHHVDAVYGYLAFRTRSREDAEALTQETFARAMRALDQLDSSRQSAGIWLLTIARSVYVDARRRRGTEPRVGSGVDPGVAAGLGRLERREREAIALRFGAEMRSAEIAEVLGTSVSSAQQVLSRALRRLRPRVLDDGAGA